MCVWFLFFSLSNDVSTFMKMNIVKIIWWMNWLIRKSMKVVYWLNVDWFRRTKKSIIDLYRKLEKENRQLIVVVTDSLIDWFSKQKKLIIDSFRWFENVLCKFFIQFTKIRFVISWLFQKIWIERQVNSIHRFQKKKLFH